jgi:hypothetical protein
MSKLSGKIREEFLALLPPTIFFFVALHIVALVRMLMLEGTGLAPAVTISIAVAALILGTLVPSRTCLPLRRVEDAALPVDVGAHSLSGTPVRFCEASRRSRRRQREAAHEMMADFFAVPGVVFN